MIKILSNTTVNINGKPMQLVVFETDNLVGKITVPAGENTNTYLASRELVLKEVLKPKTIEEEIKSIKKRMDKAKI